MLDLRRDDLRELRFSHLKIMKLLSSILELSVDRNQTDCVRKVACVLRNAMREDAKFSSMVIDLFEPTSPLLIYMQQSGD